jgi:phosphate transport system substrate-binding protein
MVRLKTFITVLIFVLVSGCNSPKTNKESGQQKESFKSELKGSFSITGAYALYPLILKLAEEFMVIHPVVKI